MRLGARLTQKHSGSIPLKEHSDISGRFLIGYFNLSQMTSLVSHLCVQTFEQVVRKKQTNKPESTCAVCTKSVLIRLSYILIYIFYSKIFPLSFLYRVEQNYMYSILYICSYQRYSERPQLHISVFICI